MNPAGEIASHDGDNVERGVARRLGYGVIAVIATSIGLLGVWLPVLPTTPFVLVALWAASRSSQRLAEWLRRLPILRAAVSAADRYASDRSITLRLKVLSQVMAYGAIVLVWLATESVALVGLAGACAISSSVFMAYTPTASLSPVEASRSPHEPSSASRSLDTGPPPRPAAHLIARQ